ncbi:MAG: thrombospondin type 3 repeat-containing protein [Candidatus Heimdallarchaeum endolithica]|uniref:Thrombospondin type 3 repeat-containing protein n=1 Tax=Candidatus Heimdallarchaeum endolithica TaxID=2876572 RepID=A0A9Y1BRR7_9ARCH|nr:MAG: thrombospondin type 3 repeat-containing protein [Candidatus Heimdallarchaeum endolithica]
MIVIFYNSELEIGNCYSKWNGSSRYPIETDYGFIYDEFPINDTDRDQLNDSLEVFNYETDPFLADSDGDLLNDFDELINYGTNPNSSDTDEDGMPDKWEVDNSLDPTTDDTDEDPDNDGLTNIQEYLNNTDPNNPDTDGDGYSDSEEIEKGSNPTDNTDKPLNLGLILGLSLGIPVVIIATSLFIMKKKGLLFFRKK